MPTDDPSTPESPPPDAPGRRRVGRPRRAATLETPTEVMELHLEAPSVGRGRRRRRAYITYPLVPVRDTVLFPHMVSPLFVLREKSVKAIEEAMGRDRTVLVVAQRDPSADDVEIDDLYEVGTEAVIGRMLRMPDGTTSILVQGQRRVRLVDIAQDHPYVKVRGVPIDDVIEKSMPLEAQMRAVLALFEKCVQLSRSLPNDAYVAAMNVDEPGWLADLIASSLEIDVARRQEVLEALDAAERLSRVSQLLSKELDILELENKIHSQVQKEVDKNQREYFLREQLKAIQGELGQLDSFTREVNELKERFAAVHMSPEAQERAQRELDRLAALPAASPEVGVIRNYLDWLIEIPWDARSEDNLDIAKAARVLDANHFGLKKVKERILEYLAVRKLSGAMRSPILCFQGPPGVGKTSLGRSIADAMGRTFVRLSLGGIHDEAEIRGHRRTYVGALPGRIIQTMRTAKTVNPLFVLDEIDKVGADFRGDPSAALLEVLDPEQNSKFSDHYLEVPYDLSQVIFITTANIIDPIPPALRDRMEIVELPGYTEVEKLHIAEQFLVPRQLKEHGIPDGQLTFRASALQAIIREHTHEAGVRNLEREIASICRKVARLIAEEKPAPRVVTPALVTEYLGPQKVWWNVAEECDEVGVATGVAWTEAGGDLITIEVTLMEGKGNLTLTGQLGDVMRESAQAALSYTRSRAAALGIRAKFAEEVDIHIHVPAGAIPKDGPSAGITMATALISALTGRPVRRDVAMTGEITLRGHVLPVGGLKEKILAAQRNRIATFVLPKKNKKDLVDIPRSVLRQVTFLPVTSMDEVLDAALLPAPEKRPARRRRRAAVEQQPPANGAAPAGQPEPATAETR